jgi:hypothetical protein
MSVVTGGHRLGSAYLMDSGPESALAALALGSPQVASMFTSADAYDRNSPPRLAFYWTNSSRPTTSLDTLLWFRNSSIH